MANFTITSNFQQQFADNDLTMTVNDAVVDIGDTVKDGDNVFFHAGSRKIIAISYTDYHMWGLGNVSYTVAPDGSSASTVWKDPAGHGDDYVFTFQTAEPDTSENYVLTQEKIDTFANDEISVFVNGEQATANQDVLEGDKFELVSTLGFISIQAFNPSTGLPLDFVISGDELTATLDPFIKVNGADFNISYTLKEPIVDTDVRGVNDVYLLTDEQTEKVITERFVFYTGSTSQEDFKDYGVFILGLIRLPFEISGDLIGFDSTVKLGDKDTGVTASRLTVDKFTLNLGDIQVIGDKNNLLDYANKKAVIHLPYCESVEIDVDYCVNETVAIEYVINAYDGVTTVNVYSSKIDGIVESKSVDLNIKIPFATVENTAPSNNSPYNIEMGADNGILKPFIEIVSNDAILENGFFTIPILDENALQGESGFIRVEEIDLKVSASKDEKQTIINLLNDGVIIQ